MINSVIEEKNTVELVSNLKEGLDEANNLAIKQELELIELRTRLEEIEKLIKTKDDLIKSKDYAIDVISSLIKIDSEKVKLNYYDKEKLYSQIQHIASSKEKQIDLLMDKTIELQKKLDEQKREIDLLRANHDKFKNSVFYSLYKKFLAIR